MKNKEKAQIQFGAMDFVSRMANHIYDAFHMLNTNGVSITVNYRRLNIQILEVSGSVIWIKWGKYDCPFKDLPPTAMSLIVIALQDYIDYWK